MMRLRVGVAVPALLLIMAPTAWAADTTPPSVPTNLHTIGTFASWPVLGWDASTDDSGVVDHYRVMVNGSQAYRPQTTSVRIDDLVRYDHVFPGHTYTIAIQAVDRAGNRSASSSSIEVTVS